MMSGLALLVWIYLGWLVIFPRSFGRMARSIYVDVCKGWEEEKGS